MKKILVVDDLEGVRQLLTTTLARARYQILTARNGSTAVEMVKEQQSPRALLLRRPTGGSMS